MKNKNWVLLVALTGLALIGASAPSRLKDAIISGSVSIGSTNGPAVGKSLQVAGDSNLLGNLDALQEVRISGAITAGSTSVFVDAMGIGDAQPAHSSAVLDVKSTTKGLLPPRMTEAQRDAIVSPQEGLVIYNSSTGALNVYSGGLWGAIGGGSGGGSGIQFMEADNAPFTEFSTGYKFFAYTAAITQTVSANIFVPDTYVAGDQITMNVYVLDFNGSGTSLIQSTTTLIREANDIFSATTNQHTSTNSALTNTGSTLGRFRTVTLDLTNASGQINSVAVAAGDLLKVDVSRGTDTDTGDLYLFSTAVEVKFK